MAWAAPRPTIVGYGWLWLAMAGMDAMGADAKSDTPAIQSPSVQ
ncbi:MAG: hypothetical protein WBD13_00825 [Burkholderiaceae bacterium]